MASAIGSARHRSTQASVREPTTGLAGYKPPTAAMWRCLARQRARGRWRPRTRTRALLLPLAFRDASQYTVSTSERCANMAGRKPIGDVAMTSAERARSYRQRRKETARKLGRLAGVDASIAEKVSTMALMDTLRNCVTQHDRRNGLRVLAVIAARLRELPDQVDAFDLGDAEN